MELSEKKWALLIDGSALYFGQRVAGCGHNLMHRQLNDTIRKFAVGSTLAPRPAYFFTPFDDNNEKQRDFNKFVAALGWAVQAVPMRDALISNSLLNGDKVRITRFDAIIGYVLGCIKQDEQKLDHIVVVSDSWPLSWPICHASRSVPVTVAYFGAYIDRRWHKLFLSYTKEPDQIVRFFDLDIYHDKLFGTPLKRQAQPEIALSDLR